MSNPFERPDASYLVLINPEDQYSLWPQDIEVPAGWTVCFGPQAKEACIAHIDATWTDMRPRSLREAMEEDRVRRSEAG
ncbi:MbtH family protein [Pseudomonas sp. SDO528_S397]